MSFVPTKGRYLPLGNRRLGVGNTADSEQIHFLLILGSSPRSAKADERLPGGNVRTAALSTLLPLVIRAEGS